MKHLPTILMLAIGSPVWAIDIAITQVGTLPDLNHPNMKFTGPNHTLNRNLKHDYYGYSYLIGLNSNKALPKKG